jgi:hypothetical protein
MSTTRSYPPLERMSNPMDPGLQPKTSSKRKRESLDQNGHRKPPGHWSTSSSTLHGNGHNTESNEFLLSTSNETNSISHHIAQHLASASPSTAAAALAANMPQLTVPQPTELSFPSTGSGNDADRQLDSSFDIGGGSDGDQNQHTQGGHYNLDPYQGTTGAESQSVRDQDGSGGKPAVGTDEWHKVRRDNHKEGQFWIPRWAGRLLTKSISGTSSSRNYQ